MFKKDNEEINREIYRNLAAFALTLIEEGLAEGLSEEEIRDTLNKCKKMLKKEVNKDINVCLDLIKIEEINRFCRDMELGCNIEDLKESLENYMENCRNRDTIIRDFLDEVREAVINVRKSKNLLKDESRILCILFNKVIGCHADLRHRCDLSRCIRCDNFDSNTLSDIYQNIYEIIRNNLSNVLQSEINIINVCLDQEIRNTLIMGSIPGLSIICGRYEVSFHPCVFVCKRYSNVLPNTSFTGSIDKEGITVKFYGYTVMEIRRRVM